jgi:ABC-type transport system involved in multi-copper enzyme maturation permease subunit
MFLMIMIICIIVFLGGQIQQDRYKKRDTIFILCMLVFTLVGYFIVSYVKDIKVSGVVILLSFITMLIANIVGYNT